MTYTKKLGEHCYNAFGYTRFMQKVDCPFYKQGMENEAKEEIEKKTKGANLEDTLKIHFYSSCGG